MILFFNSHNEENINLYQQKMCTLSLSIFFVDEAACQFRAKWLSCPCLGSAGVSCVFVVCIPVWSGSCSASDQKSLQRVVRTAKKITRISFPPIQDVAKKHCLTRADDIRSDTSHPHHGLLHFHLHCELFF